MLAHVAFCVCMTGTKHSAAVSACVKKHVLPMLPFERHSFVSKLFDSGRFGVRVCACVLFFEGDWAAVFGKAMQAGAAGLWREQGSDELQSGVQSFFVLHTLTGSLLVAVCCCLLLLFVVVVVFGVVVAVVVVVVAVAVAVCCCCCC